MYNYWRGGGEGGGRRCAMQILPSLTWVFLFFFFVLLSPCTRFFAFTSCGSFLTLCGPVQSGVYLCVSLSARTHVGQCRFSILHQPTSWTLCYSVYLGVGSSFFSKQVIIWHVFGWTCSLPRCWNIASWMKPLSFEPPANSLSLSLSLSPPT